MQVHENLKELLEAYNKELFKFLDKYDSDYIKENVINDFLASNCLALGKPEPLAKNKQFDNSCELDKQGLACWCDVKLDDYKTCPYNNKQE